MQCVLALPPRDAQQVEFKEKMESSISVAQQKVPRTPLQQLAKCRLKTMMKVKITTNNQ